MKKLLLISLLLVIATAIVAQKKALESISENDLKAHLEFIASDYMQGRDFNTPIPGLEITAYYLRSQCEKLGLKPAGENYFQVVPMISVKPDTMNSAIQLLGKNNELLFESRDFIEYVDSVADETIDGKLVFCGYGWKDENTGYNDLAGIDVRNKIVMFMTRNRELSIDTTKKGWFNEIEISKLENIFASGAKGILMCDDPKNIYLFDSFKKDFSKGNMGLENKVFKIFKGQVINISHALAETILETQGKTLEELQKQINDTGKPNSFEMGNINVRIKLSRTVKPLGSGRNIIGIIEGCDPNLKDECVLYTAHYDHIGINDNQKVYNGADDNGSGTVALLEIAEAYTKLKKAPKRSIVFNWVTAEEKGLLGSDFYTQHPTFPLDKTLVNINLDMIGRSAEADPAEDADLFKSLAGANGMYIVSGKQSTELMEMSNKTCEKLNLKSSDALSDKFLHRSDYFNFYKKGIPILGITTGLHEDYHRASDDIDKIDFNKMKRVAQYSFLIGKEVADKNKRIEVDNPASVEQL